jgi:hypothetical protein
MIYNDLQQSVSQRNVVDKCCSQGHWEETSSSFTTTTLCDRTNTEQDNNPINGYMIIDHLPLCVETTVIW